MTETGVRKTPKTFPTNEEMRKLLATSGTLLTPFQSGMREEIAQQLLQRNMILLEEIESRKKSGEINDSERIAINVNELNRNCQEILSHFSTYQDTDK